ncbi:MAG: DinB family protein [Woeseiaceae bacterium]
MDNSELPSPLTTLCRDNLLGLDRLRLVVERLSDSQYAQATPPCNSGIGAHVRHVLDHYDAFFSGVDNGVIDYDRRRRDPETEVSRAKAQQRIRLIKDQLERLSNIQAVNNVRVIMDCGSSDSTTVEADSSLVRELQFLVSHTVHHDALIAASANTLNIDLDKQFGVAPSTLRYSECGG